MDNNIDTPQLNNGNPAVHHGAAGIGMPDDIKAQILLALHKGTSSHREIAREFGVSNVSVSRLARKNGVSSPHGNAARREQSINDNLRVARKATDALINRKFESLDADTVSKIGERADRSARGHMDAQDKIVQPEVDYTPDPGMRMLINLQVINQAG